MAHFLCIPCYMVEGDRWHSCTIFNLCKFYPYVLGFGIWFANFHGCLMFGGREREGLVYRFQRLNTKPCSFLVLVIQEFPACKRGKSGILALGVEGMGMGWEVNNMLIIKNKKIKSRRKKVTLYSSFSSSDAVAFAV